MKPIALLIALLTLLLPACDLTGQSISDKLAAEFDSGRSPIDMAKLGPEEWERFCVLGPYSMNESAEKLLGFKWDVDSKSKVGVDDSITLLLFVKDNAVLAYSEHPRSKGDFLKLEPRCLNRSQAVLVRQPNPGGAIQLVAR
jgi:hypothetical protein